MKAAAVLAQDEIWIDGALRVHAFAEMDPDHRANLIPFLRGNAMSIAIACGVPTSGRQEAEDWLAETPLMRRLCELEAGRPIEERRRTAERNAEYERRTGYEKVRLG